MSKDGSILALCFCTNYHVCRTFLTDTHGVNSRDCSWECQRVIDQCSLKSRVRIVLLDWWIGDWNECVKSPEKYPCAYLTINYKIRSVYCLIVSGNGTVIDTFVCVRSMGKRLICDRMVNLVYIWKVNTNSAVIESDHLVVLSENQI